MYLNHWNLQRPPFEAQPDSRFLFLTEQNEQALAALSYAAREAGEPALLTAPPGCGKTILLRALRRQLPREQYLVAFVPEVVCSQVGLLRRLAYHLSRKVVGEAAAAMDVIWGQVAAATQAGRGVVVMLDDWPPDASRAAYEELRWLLKLDVEGCRLAVVLAGDGIDPARHWPPWLAQRLLTHVQLGPLARQQVPGYLAHRFAAARTPEAPGQNEPPGVFTPEAAALIAEWSGGVPRLINRLAHLALHVACLDLARRVQVEAVRRALDRLAAAPALTGTANVVSSHQGSTPTRVPVAEPLEAG